MTTLPSRPDSRSAPRARTLLVLFLLAASLLGALATGAVAQQDLPEDTGDEVLRTVDILPLQGYIDPPVAGAIIDVIDEANDRDSEVVVIQLDAAGSISADLDELIGAIRSSEVPVVVFIGPGTVQAEAGGSALALLYAAHIAAAADDALIGPAAPLDLGDAPDEARRSEALALLRGLAHEQLDADLGDGTTVVEALVDGRVEVVRLLEVGALDVVAPGLGDLLTELDGRTVDTVAGIRDIRIRNDEIGVRLHSLGLMRRILHAATTPTLIYILLVVGLAMLLFEWFQPGFGVAGFTGILLVVLAGFGLAVLPVAWWALGLLLLGLGLYAIDTAIAGFGPVTLAATAAFWFGSDRLYTSPSLDLATGVIALMTASALVFFVVVITIVLRAQAGPDDLAIEELVDRPGIVRSVLNPEGHVYVDGALWRARWVGEAKRAKVGTPVRVTGTDGALVLVEPFVARAGEATPDAREVLTGQGADDDSPR